MSKILAIDVGNTNVKYGLFVDGELIESCRQELSAAGQGCAAILDRVNAPVSLASVVPSIGEQIGAACTARGLKLFTVESGSQSLLSGMNREMGADRVADAYAAYKLYGMCRRPVLVMGFGTATTLLAISADGHVVGGWIAPGIRPTLEVLHDRTALLPLLDMQGQTEAFGFDTASHMRNGVFLGHVGLAQYWLEVGRKLLASGSTGTAVRPLSVATGGWAETIQEHLPIFDAVDPLLTLKGVYLIGEGAGLGTKKARSARPRKSTK